MTRPTPQTDRSTRRKGFAFLRSRTFSVGVASLLLIASGDPAQAKVRTVWDCRIGDGHAVVLVDKDEIAFRYTSPGRPPFAVVTAPGSDDVHVLRTVVAGPEAQLRFRAGTSSYVVYSMKADKAGHFNPVSGMAIVDSGRLIIDHACRNDAKMRERIPKNVLEDDPAWSAANF